MSKITVRWEAGDGYAGKSRPQSFEIDTEDYEHLDHEEREAQLHKDVDEDFRNKVVGECSNLEEVLEELAKLDVET